MIILKTKPSIRAAIDKYQSKNREIINLKKKEMIYCETCSIKMQKTNKSNHLKSKTHITNLKLGEDVSV